jgi:23S rRNA (cytosine1962-C5)-methyltransferase
VREPEVVISHHGASRLLAGHLWVYRSDIRSASAQGGDVVCVRDERGRLLGRAFYSDRSEICLRLVTREDVPVDRALLLTRIARAAELRRSIVGDAAAYRVVYGESDQLPSLIVDRYGDYLVLQTLSQATERRKQELVEILLELFAPRGIVERNDPKVRLLEGLDQRVSLLWGTVPEEVVVREGPLEMAYDLFHGQKTGGFLDQRENRPAAARYARGQALDCFAGTGGFTLAIAGRCTSVEAVDLSAEALQLLARNAERNRVENVSVREGNAFDLLRQYDDSGRRFDCIILDPPAFAKNKQNIPAAYRGYKEINLRSLKILRPGGILITCSCSHHISESMFWQILHEASRDAGRHLTILEKRTQSSDHPILISMPETYYLKCFICNVL